MAQHDVMDDLNASGAESREFERIRMLTRAASKLLDMTEKGKIRWVEKASEAPWSESGVSYRAEVGELSFRLTRPILGGPTLYIEDADAKERLAHSAIVNTLWELVNHSETELRRSLKSFIETD